MKYFFFCFFLFLNNISLQAQVEREIDPSNREEVVTEEEEIEVETAPITMYNIISVDNDTTYVDTSLSIYEDYSFNYLRKDNFELLPFSNVGQPYNQLAYRFKEDDDLLPEFGARARHFNFMEAEDIRYYSVATPFTELYFRTVFEQGQTLDAFFTVNTSENLNFSLAYKGLRSLGKYQHILTSSGNFRATLSYNTPNGKYRLQTHFVSQDLFGEENGGLTPRSLEQYLAQNPEFDDRSRLDVNFEDAESTLLGKRFFLDHVYDLFEAGDNVAINGLAVGHQLNVVDKEYHFTQATPSELFGPSFEGGGIRDETELEFIDNELYLQYYSETLGRLQAKASHNHYRYGYNTVLVLESGIIPNKIVGDNISVGGGYTNKVGDFLVDADGEIIVSGEFDGYHLDGQLSYLLKENVLVTAALNVESRAPNFNFLLYQSDYINYNWLTQFSNIETQNLNVRILAPSLLNLDAEFSRIKDYTYFALGEEELVKPFQNEGLIEYARIKAQREFSLGKISLENTVLYQKVLKGEEILNVPDFVTRNTLYYTDYWFQRALFLQTGLTFKYFPGYSMNAYDPVLAEFYVQNEQEIEGFPTVDFFFNAKVRQARIFFKLEHVNSLITGNNNFSAPLYPYRDFGIRFGLLWNFFM